MTNLFELTGSIMLKDNVSGQLDKIDKNAKKKEMMELLKKKWRSDINKNFTTVLRSNPESLPSLRLKFKTRNKGYREYMQQVAPKMYIKLTEKIGKSN